jgi:hypothetical protein
MPNVYADPDLRFAMRGHHTWLASCRCVDEENVLCGKDSIRYGSPQDQIQAFRSFSDCSGTDRSAWSPELTTALEPLGRCCCAGGTLNRRWPGSSTRC